MKKYITILLLLLLLGAFITFSLSTTRTKEVLDIITPTKIGIDINKNRYIDSNEIFCIDNIDTFSLEPTTEFINKYNNSLHLSEKDLISLGYLSQEFAQKTLLNKNVSIKLTPKVTTECQFAKIKINNIDYSKLLLENGYGIQNNKIYNIAKFKQNLNIARKLHLVIFNHHSNKYHELWCPYGKLAHDKILIPLKQLPKNAKPCKFCHKQKIKHKKAFKYKKDININNIHQIKTPPLKIIDGNIDLYLTDFTKQLKPTNTCTTDVCKAFINLTNNANSTIDIALYGFDGPQEIITALKNAKNRGVKIRFIYDSDHTGKASYYTGNEQIKEIADISIPDKCSSATQSNMLMHNKFIIFDNNIIYTGSMNFSKSGLSGYDANNTIVITSKEIAQLYTKEFEQMINGKFHNSKIKLNLPNIFQLKNSTIEVYFSPQDKPSDRIVQLIKNSKHYVYIPTFLITHTKISNALIEAHNRGIDVKVIMDANSVYTRNTKHHLLRSNGIPIKIENYAGKMHSKTMIIDNEYLILGSMNFSNSGENKNDENLLIIKDKVLATHYKNFFNYLWTIIPNRYLKFNPKPESKDSIGSCTDGIDNNFNGKIDLQEEFCK